MNLRTAASSPSQGMDLQHLDTFLEFLAQRLSAPDLIEAESLLQAALDPQHARSRNRAATKP